MTIVRCDMLFKNSVPFLSRLSRAGFVGRIPSSVPAKASTEKKAMIITIDSFGVSQDYNVTFTRDDIDSLDVFLVKLGYEASKKQLVEFRATGNMSVFRYCRKKGKHIVIATVTDVTEVRKKEEEERARIAWIKKAEAIVIKHDASVFTNNINFKDIERLQKLNALVRSRNRRITKIKSAVERERA